MPKAHEHIHQGDMWAITEGGLDQAALALSALHEYTLALQARSDEDEDSLFGTRSLFSKEGSVGIIGIKGPLVNSDSIFNALFGLTSYGEIRTALYEALADADVKTIMLDIDSPGGAVNGVADLADLISAVSDHVKPVYAYTDGSMASGAYWLGAGARQIFASQTAVVGSVGVIMTHMEQSRRLENEGIKATVLRAGRFKQMGNPNEPLTDEGKAELQSMLDSVYKVFVTHVCESRGRPYDYTDQNMAQGRVFLGENAVHAGLVDQITNFDAALAAVSAKSFDTDRNSFENNGIGATMKNNNKKLLVSEVQAALIAAGHIAAPAVESAPAAPVAETVEPEATVATETATEVLDAEPGTLEVIVTADMVAAVPVVSEGIAILKAQLKERDDTLLEAKLENKTLADKLEALEVATTALQSIAVKSLNAMQVALGGSATDYSGASASEVLAAHARASTDFSKNYPVGGVAAVTSTTSLSTKKVATDSHRAAQLAATQL